MLVREDQETGDLYLGAPELYEGTEEGHRTGGILEEPDGLRLWANYMAACRMVGAAKNCIMEALKPITDEYLRSKGVKP